MFRNGNFDRRGKSLGLKTQATAFAKAMVGLL